MRKERILCTFPWYYTISGGYCVTIRVEMRMHEPIDGDALRKAVDITMSRYPYLGKRLKASPFRYYLVENREPVAVIRTNGPVTLGGREANGHQFAFSYWGNSIYLNQTHGIFDGRGSYPFTSTLLYYYCLYRYGENLSVPKMNLAGTPVNPDEYSDPYRHPFPKCRSNVKNPDRLRQALKLEKMGLVTPSRMRYCRIKINEVELMKLCKSSDASPNTALSVLVCRAIRRLHPEVSAPVVTSIFCDTRSALKAEHSHYSLAAPLCLSYDNRMDSMEFSVQNTIFRGKLMVLSDDDSILRQQRRMKALYKALNLIPLLCVRKFAGRIGRWLSFRTCTFFISYARNSSFGDCDKHLELYSPLQYIKGSGLTLEVSTVDDSFMITWLQEWKEWVYLDAFLEQCRQVGLGYELLDRGEMITDDYILSK